MTMKVETKHPSYAEWEASWRQCRDCYQGSMAVKAGGVLYLPPLDSHRGTEGVARYGSYLQRALFYNAMGRRVDGLAGAVFQKEPVWELPGPEGTWEAFLHEENLFQNCY